MHRIQNSAINKPTFLNKTTAGLVCVLGISALAIAVIGLTGSADSSNAIGRLGSDINNTILDVSIAILILDLFWIAKLYRKSHIQNVVASNAKRLKPISLHKNLCHDTSKVILSYLSPNDLARSCVINKHWHTLASAPGLWNAFHLNKLFPTLRVFNELDWAHHVDLTALKLSMADAPPSNKRKEIAAIHSLLSRPIEGNAGVTLLTMPKGLTLRKLKEIAQSPKFGHAIIFFVSNKSIPLDRKIDKTYRIVITNNIFSKTRNLSFNIQKKIIKDMSCDVPKLLEAATLLLVTSLTSKQILYSPDTLTRCAERFYGGRHHFERVHVGFRDCIFIRIYSAFGEGVISNNFGIAGVLRNL